ncbi:MAG: hypothetical protein JWR15_894 [Prosthecobacter sp.]|nr:hypothetical protein [Prosthecobacter sp.]
MVPSSRSASKVAISFRRNELSVASRAQSLRFSMVWENCGMLRSSRGARGLLSLHTFVNCLLKLISTAVMMSESVNRITMLLIQRVLYLVSR